MVLNMDKGVIKQPNQQNNNEQNVNNNQSNGGRFKRTKRLGRRIKSDFNQSVKVEEGSLVDGTKKFFKMIIPK